MSNFDWLDLDARLLRLLVTVVDTGSVTAAAQRLGVTQSAVSHLLDKLRAITGDALFTKSGRGIVATAHALALAHKARDLLAHLEHFAQRDTFDPAHWRGDLTIAANDFQRDTLLPALLAVLRREAPGLNLHIIPSDVPSADMLRQQQCQLIISPRPPDATDVVQKRLFSDDYRVFYDASQRSAPLTRADYESADHVSVLYAPHLPLAIDRRLTEQGVQRRLRVTVTGFGGLPAFLRGTDMLATAPSRLGQHLLRDFAQTPVPVPCPELPMYLIWHKRHHDDAAHRWLRQHLETIVQSTAT